jgi:hypothetical protein
MSVSSSSFGKMIFIGAIISVGKNLIKGIFLSKTSNIKNLFIPFFYWNSHQSVIVDVLQQYTDDTQVSQ